MCALTGFLGFLVTFLKGLLEFLGGLSRFCRDGAAMHSYLNLKINDRIRRLRKLTLFDIFEELVEK